MNALKLVLTNIDLKFMINVILPVLRIVIITMTKQIVSIQSLTDFI